MDRGLIGRLWPSCARCSRPVERIEWEFEGYTRWMIFTVFCHGENESSRLSAMDVVDGARGGLAFVPRPALASPTEAPSAGA